MQGTAGAAQYGNDERPAVLVIAHDDAGGRLAEEAAELAGLRLLRRTALESASEALATTAAVEVIAVEAQGAPDRLAESAFARVDAVAAERGASVVVVVDPGQVDLAAAHLLGRGRQILCQPGATERTSALSMAKMAPRGAELNQPEADTARLRRLNEEVARIADTLARLTRGEEAAMRGSGPVRAPGMDFRDSNFGAVSVGAAELRAVIRARRLRAQFFPADLFADPAWDMLLDLFAAELERRQVSVSSLCIAAAVPPTTALRWIGTLHEFGLFERQPDPSDRRRAYIGLSPKGLEGMQSYAGAVKRAGLQLV